MRPGIVEALISKRHPFLCCRRPGSAACRRRLRAQKRLPGLAARRRVLASWPYPLSGVNVNRAAEEMDSRSASAASLQVRHTDAGVRQFPIMSALEHTRVLFSACQDR